jgi:hypothetical protein
MSGRRAVQMKMYTHRPSAMRKAGRTDAANSAPVDTVAVAA